MTSAFYLHSGASIKYGPLIVLNACLLHAAYFIEQRCATMLEQFSLSINRKKSPSQLLTWLHNLA